MITVFDKKQDCCGCTACKNICPTQAITMKADEEGFLYPLINLKLCIDCKLCRKVCAFQGGYDTSNNIDRPEVYALKHKSDEVRRNSSSGGAFTAISDFILSKNGVIYGATFDKKFRVIHQQAKTAEERDKFRGSKYVQSDLKEVFSQIKEEIENDIYVMFTGTGCQVSGLHRYLVQSKVDTEKLLTVDFICHGTPSPRIYSDYISYVESKNKSKIKQYFFRSKVNGWGHTEEAVFENGKRDHSSLLSQTYKALFYSNLCLRPSCHNCKYTNFLRPADITIADYWGIENYFPKFKDLLGISAVIVNSIKGETAFKESMGWFDSLNSNMHDCSLGQRNLYAPSPINPRRDEFWLDYTQYGFGYVIKKYTGYGIKKRSKLKLIYILKKFKVLNIARKIFSNGFSFKK